jgi:putative ABC transport system ATP-binding protein
MSALSVSAVVKWRGLGSKRQCVLSGTSFELAPGDVLMLEGPSGSGKTTLLGVCAGLITPDEGHVVLSGVALGGLRAGQLRAQRARALGFVFQRANLLERSSALENIALAGLLGGMTRRAAEVEGQRLLAALGIAALAGRRITQLSGGEEQRVAVARALVHRPRVVLADEPTASLDAEAGRAVIELLTGLAAERGAALLIATHDPRILSFGTRRLRLANGRAWPSGASLQPPQRDHWHADFAR